MDKSYTRKVLMRLDVSEISDSDGNTSVIAKVAVPFDMHMSVSLIQSFYNRCQLELERVPVSVYTLEWHWTDSLGLYAKVRGGRKVTTLQKIAFRRRAQTSNEPGSALPLDDDVTTASAADDEYIDEDILAELEANLFDAGGDGEGDEMEDNFDNLVAGDIAETGEDIVAYHEELMSGFKDDETVADPEITEARFNADMRSAAAEVCSDLAYVPVDGVDAGDVPSSDDDSDKAESLE
eukprot:11169184-Karenia_brevis.AAC.1